jgi:hypothetical protein
MDATGNEPVETQYCGCCVVDLYNSERNHQGLDNRLIAGRPVIDKASHVRRRPRLGGLLSFYERAA